MGIVGKGSGIYCRVQALQKRFCKIGMSETEIKKYVNGVVGDTR